jgi:hypothetical protein
MKFNEIIPAMRALIAQSPDNVYVPPGGPGQSCHYREGVCTNGTIGCVVGQLFGGAIEDGVPISVVVDRIARAYDTPVDADRVTFISKWLRTIQEGQDAGMDWGAALTRSDTFWPMVAGYTW